MTTTAMPLTTRISQSTTLNTSYRTLRTQFGNGYEQRSIDGINYKQDNWKVNYENLNATDRATVWAFLAAVGGVGVITWTPPNGIAGKFVLDQGTVSEQQLSGNIFTISFTVRQVFDL